MRIISMTDEKERKEATVHLEWMDYVAIIIASLQTTLLPFLIVVVVLLALWFLIAR